MRRHSLLYQVVYIAALVAVSMTFFSCGSANLSRSKQVSCRWVKKNLAKYPALSTGVTGIVVQDAASGKMLVSYNKDQYFVPASNAKIVTLYATLTAMGDSLPLVRYVQTDSSLVLWPCANPAFLHPSFESGSALQRLLQLAKGKKVYLSRNHASLPRFGPGWMWDDYSGYYQPELATFPLYGNCISVVKDSTKWTILPTGLLDGMPEAAEISRIRRSEFSNQFLLPAGMDTMRLFRQEIPYFNADSVNIALVSRHLSATVIPSQLPLPQDAGTLYSIDTDTVCRRMMQVSDNMLADHLLLGCGMALTDTLQLDKAIPCLLQKRFQSWKEMPVWVDGSGLSRYNLFTPGQIMDVLVRLYHMMPLEKLCSMMATGGKTGTLQRSFGGESSPYMFAKTGSMSGVYNLSGYMRAASGKWLIFSCMSNNINAPVSQARKETHAFLESILRKH